MNNTTSILNRYTELTVGDTSIGAIIFIIVVLLWYSSSIVFLLGMQIGTSNEIFDDSTKRRTELFVQSLRKQSTNNEILKELVDKQKRDKLWDIYLGTSSDMHDKITHAETLRIRNIEKQLATINPYRQDSNPRILDHNFVTYSHSNLCSLVMDFSPLDSRLRTRRRSSLDHKILNEWRTLADELRTHENWPWRIQKLLIRRQLRRQRHASECQSVL